MLDYRNKTLTLTKEDFISYFNSTENCPITVNPLTLPVGSVDTTIKPKALEKLLTFDVDKYELTINGTEVDLTYPKMLMLPFEGYVWGYASSYPTTLYLILDFQKYLKMLRTEKLKYDRWLAE